MKKWLIVAAVAGVLVAGVFSQRTLIVARVLEAGLEDRVAANALAALDDGLHLALCGAGGPMPAPKASGPCVAVVAGDRLFVVDAGTDGARNLARMGYPVGAVEAVLLTHFHSDHIDGLGELGTLRWAAGDLPSPLPVYGPPGVSAVVDGFNQAYAHDWVYRHAHHGDTVAPLAAAGWHAMEFATPPEGKALTLINEGELTVRAIAVDHSPVSPAVGYRFDYQGRSLLITGDTVKTETIARFADGVDLLVHEALAPNLVGMLHDAAVKVGDNSLAKITTDILDYHASPMDAATTARDANVGHLLYYHIVPPLVLPGQEALYLNGAESVFPRYTVGEDGTAFSLPANSDAILQTADGL